MSKYVNILRSGLLRSGLFAPEERGSEGELTGEGRGKLQVCCVSSQESGSNSGGSCVALSTCVNYSTLHFIIKNMLSYLKICLFYCFWAASGGPKGPPPAAQKYLICLNMKAYL